MLWLIWKQLLHTDFVFLIKCFYLFGWFLSLLAHSWDTRLCNHVFLQSLSLEMTIVAGMTVLVITLYFYIVLQNPIIIY